MKTAALLLFIASVANGAGFDLTPPTIGPAAYPIQNVRVATNGKTFLTVWRMDTFGGGAHIYGSVADAQGQLLTPESFLIVPFAGATDIQLIPYGNDYVMSWIGSPIDSYNAAELSSEGKIVRTFTLPFGRTVSNGESFLVLTLTTPSCPCAPTLAAQLLDRDGHLVKSFDLSHDFGPHVVPFQATAIGGDFAVATATTTGIVMDRISANGELKPTLPIDGDTADNITIVASGTDALVSWSESTDIFATVVHADGTATTKSQIASALDGKITNIHSGYMADGDVVIAVLQTGTDASEEFHELVFRLDSNGASSGSTRVDDCPNPLLSSIAISANRIDEATIFALPTGSRVDSRSFSSRADEVREDVLSELSHRQVAPVVVSDGLEFLTAWSDQTAETQAITATSVANGIATSARSANDVQRANGFMGEYAIAYGGSSYLVVWHYWRQLWAQRFNAVDMPIDPAPILVADDIQNLNGLTAGWNGERFVILWLQGVGIFEANVNADGTVSPTRQAYQVSQTSPLSEVYSAPDLAFDGTHFLLVVASYPILSVGQPDVPPDLDPVPMYQAE